MTKLIDENDIILFGKYKGESLQDILKTDPIYLKWLSQQHFAVDDKRFQELYKKAYDPSNPISTFGKTKHNSLSWILGDDFDYVEWITNPDNVISRYPDLKSAMIEFFY